MSFFVKQLCIIFSVKGGGGVWVVDKIYLAGRGDVTRTHITTSRSAFTAMYKRTRVEECLGPALGHLFVLRLKKCRESFQSFERMNT